MSTSVPESTLAANSCRRSTTITSEALIEQLSLAHADDRSAIVVFDADGTLWSGDVGDELYFALLEQQALRPPAQAMLRVQRIEAGLDGNAADIYALGAELFAEFRAGRVDERVMCEIIAFACAGFSPIELAALADKVTGRIRERLRPEVGRVLAWVQANRVPAYVVSASPRWVVESGAAQLGFERARVIAATLSERDGLLAPELAEPVPYGPQKLLALRQRTPLPLLAAFGDSAFDFELLSDARFPIAVRPKPALVARAAELALLELAPET